MTLSCVAGCSLSDNSGFFLFFNLKGEKLVGKKGPGGPMWFRENTEISLWFTCFSKCQCFISSRKQDWPKFSSFSRSIFCPNPLQPGEFIWGFTLSLLTLWTLQSFFFPQLLFFVWLCFVLDFSFAQWNTSLRRGEQTNHIAREIAGWLLSLPPGSACHAMSLSLGYSPASTSSSGVEPTYLLLAGVFLV